MLSEVSQIERQILYHLTYMWNLKTKQDKNKLIRKQIGGYIEVYDAPLKVFEENDKMMEEYRREIYKTIDVADLNEDYEVRIAIEDFLLKFLPYVKQSDIWLDKAKQYEKAPWQFDVHFKELTTLI